MPQKRKYDVPVSRIGIPGSSEQMLVAQVPWEHFCRPLVLRGYHQACAGKGMPVVIVAKDEEGKWYDYTLAEKEWAELSVSPTEFRWHSMSIECDEYPWEYREQ